MLILDVLVLGMQQVVNRLKTYHSNLDSIVGIYEDVIVKVRAPSVC